MRCTTPIFPSVGTIRKTTCRQQGTSTATRMKRMRSARTAVPFAVLSTARFAITGRDDTTIATGS